MFEHLTPQLLWSRLWTALWLTLLIAVPYGLAGRVELRPVIWLKPGAWELWIPLDTHIAPWLYVSFYGLLYFTGLILQETEFRKYVWVLVVTSVISALCFLLLPSGVPRDGIDVDGASRLYQWLVQVDAPRNAFPSEHASLGLIAVLALFAGKRAGWVKCAGCAWLVAIYWATIATRQHLVFDLITGAALGGAVWWWKPSFGGRAE